MLVERAKLILNGVDYPLVVGYFFLPVSIDVAQFDSDTAVGLLSAGVR
jgi:hypothetical protein